MTNQVECNREVYYTIQICKYIFVQIIIDLFVDGQLKKVDTRKNTLPTSDNSNEDMY